uniref:Uncharacterized protein n=1 Tax=Anguilla anguilla TaxID=7936 RepID=A0A0E9VUI2_ANGAN
MVCLANGAIMYINDFLRDDLSCLNPINTVFLSQYNTLCTMTELTTQETESHVTHTGYQFCILWR